MGRHKKINIGSIMTSKDSLAQMDKTNRSQTVLLEVSTIHPYLLLLQVLWDTH
jgi:hypothetical protein